MISAGLVERLDALTNDLLLEGTVETALLASILQRAQDSLANGTLAMLCARLWRTEIVPIDRPAR
jgi:hypothetical protein